MAIAAWASSLVHLSRCGLAGQTAFMALRFTVQGDTEQETAAGLQLLVEAGLELAMPPRQLTDARWMARAVPRMTKAPAEDRGPGSAG